MIAKTTVFAAILKQHGYSVTKARQAVFAAFTGHRPLTMAELVNLAPAIDRASVYRTVHLFEELGITNRLTTGWKYQLELSDLFSDHHHHATCLRCGLVIPLHEDSELEAWIDKVASRENFAADSHQLEIRGYCSNCRPVKS